DEKQIAILNALNRGAGSFRSRKDLPLDAVGATLGNYKPLGSVFMFSHVFVGVTDFDRALHFYDRLFSVLDVEQRFCDASVPWAGWHSAVETRPFFVISKPFDGQSHEVGNGQMSAFLATSRDQVRRAYMVALEAGGSGEGEPELRPQYHRHYSGAYLRDADGNKLCVACHHPE